MYTYIHTYTYTHTYIYINTILTLHTKKRFCFLQNISSKQSFKDNLYTT